MTVSPWISPPAAAKFFGVKPDTIRLLIKSGRVPALNVASPESKRPRFRVRLSDLEEVLAVQPERPAMRQKKQDGQMNVVEFF